MKKLILIRYNNPILYGNLDSGRNICSNFFVSQYPVTAKQHSEITGGVSDEKDRMIKKRATWLEAIKFCNLLNRLEGFPPSYDENTGCLIDENGEYIPPELDVMGFRFRPYKVKGFRLPTSDEWEYAAKGWTPVKKCDCYYRILENSFIWSGYNSDIFMNGKSAIETMEVNPAGLYGILGNAHEWYSDNHATSISETPPEEFRNKLCYWDEYYCRDDSIAYQMSRKVCDDAEMFGFRVVINMTSISSSRFYSF